MSDYSESEMKIARSLVRKGLEQIPNQVEGGGGLVVLRDWLKDESKPVLLAGPICNRNGEP